MAGDTPLVMIGSELGYNAGQLGNDWEDEASIYYHKSGSSFGRFGHIAISVESESLVQKFMRIGFVDTRGKTQQQVKAELEQRFGSIAKRGVRVNFYDGGDIAGLDGSSREKIINRGFAVTDDGTVWINKDYVDSGKVIDFNKTTQHEIGHIVFGEDSEYEAQYLEMAYGSFLQGISDNGYLKDNSGMVDYDQSSLTMLDRMLLNSYLLDQLQFWEGTGDDRIDSMVRYNPYAPEHIQRRQLNKIDRLEKVYRNIDKTRAEKERKAKNKRGQISKRKQEKINEEMEKETKKALSEALAAEKYENFRIITEEEKKYLEHVLRDSNRRIEYKDYSFSVQEKMSDGRYVVYESLGNPEGKVKTQEIYRNHYRSDINSIILSTMKDFYKDTYEGRAIASYGLLTIGYGVTTESATANREAKSRMLYEGIIQTGFGGVRTVTAGSLAATGYGSCKVTMGVGCAVGSVGAVNVGVGLNESLVGIQKVGYAVSSEGHPIKGTAVQEYTRLMNNQGYSSASPVNSAAIFNPIGSAIIALGGTEQDYNDFSFLTGLLLGATSQHYSIYKPYYEAYAASRMYGNQVNNTNIVIPETYYNIKAKNGYLSYESQQVIERNTGNIINSEYYYNGGYRIPYDGVKRASDYLKSIGMERGDRIEKIQSFDIGTIQVRQAGGHEYGIRYFDVLKGVNGATMNGQYLNNTFTPLTNRANLALPPS